MDRPPQEQDQAVSGPTHRPAAAAAAPDHHAGHSRHWIADLCLLATTVIWGVNLVTFKWSIHQLDPVLFNSGRLLFSMLALAGCVWIESRWLGTPFWPRERPGWPIPWRRVAVFSFLTGILYLVLYVMGIFRTTAGNTALLLSSMPMWTAVVSRIFINERLPRITWLGLLVTFAGTLLVTVGGGKVSLGSQYFFGNLLMLLAAMTWASATVLSRPIMNAMSPMQLTFLASLFTTPLHLLWIAPQLAQLRFEGWSWVGDSAALAAGQGGAAGEPAAGLDHTITPGLFLALLYCGAVSTGIAYALWNTGVKILGGSHAAIYQNVVTLVAVTGGWLFLREQTQWVQIAGGLTIIAGVLLMRRGRRA